MLSGCAPDLGTKPLPQDVSKLATAKTFQAPKADWPETEWWKAYGDPELNGLIDEALKDSPTLKIAAARVRVAMAEAGISEANLYPTIEASGNMQRTRLSTYQLGKDLTYAMPKGWHNQASISAGLQYELDFFGKNRAAFAAATSAAEAAEADRAAARLQISTAVAAVYANLVQLSTDKTLAEDALRQRKESAELVSQRFKSRLENQGELSRAEAQVWAAYTRLDTTNRLIKLTQNQLAALLGKGPDRGADIVPPKGHESLRSTGLPANLALNLIGRRPDIIAARLRVAAAASSIKVANANFYPNIDLVGSFGYETLDATYLFKKAAMAGGIGPAVSLPIFDYGRLTGQYRAARAGYDAAVAAYDQTLTDALRDVADAYANRKGVEDELAHSRAMLAESEKAYTALKARYKAGISPYLELLTAETALIDQKRVVADFETTAFTYDVALVRALGGGYAADK